MSFDKPQSIYNPSSPSDGDEIAAYLRVGAVALTKTTIGAKEALDVAANMFDGAGNAISSTGGALNVAIASIAALLSVQGNVADDAADAGNPVKVGFRAIAAALSAASAANDRVDGIADIYRRQLVNSAPNINLTQAVVEVEDTAVQLDAVVQAGRMHVVIQNHGSKAVFLGSDNTVTNTGATMGIKVAGKSSVTLSWGQFIEIWAIAETGATCDVQLSQFA